MEAGKKKVLWYTHEQLEIMEELIKITGDSQSKIVRDALSMYFSVFKK